MNAACNVGEPVYGRRMHRVTVTARVGTDHGDPDDFRAFGLTVAENIPEIKYLPINAAGQ